MALRLVVKDTGRGVVVRAYDGRKRVGVLSTVRTTTSLEVWNTEVAPEYHRRGIATAMYRAAAQIGCASGRPLRSPRYARSRAAHGFWESLVRAGAAFSDGQGDMVVQCGSPSGFAGLGASRYGTDRKTGLPLNADGTVTLYHHTSKTAARSIVRTRLLQSAGEPHVYMTTRPTPDTGYGPVAVAVRVDPRRLELDDEFPEGRRDYRISVGRPGGTLVVAGARRGLGGGKGLGYPPQPCGQPYDKFKSGWRYGDAYEHIAWREGSKGTSQRAVLRAMRKLKKAEYERYLEDCEKGAPVEEEAYDPSDYSDEPSEFEPVVNADGTVTLYYHASRAALQAALETQRLQAASQRLYVTPDPTPRQGFVAVPVRVSPRRLVAVGRRGFEIPLPKGGLPVSVRRRESVPF